MSNTIEFGIGFLAGRPNVCNIINSCYKSMIKQTEELEEQVNITIFILYDLDYMHINRIDFYNILPDVYKNIKIKYITPEDIEEEKKILKSRYGYKKEDIDLILGKGYAKARNSILYFALKRKIDYLFFWDDDEYPIANIKTNEKGKIIWKKQFNVLQHIKYIKEADVTIGYRCGNMSPVPCIEYNEEITENDFKTYIDAISNEAVSWEKVQERLGQDNGMTYADLDIVEGNQEKELDKMGTRDWLLASGICINLKNLSNIPAFYNPPEARGEDTFFSTKLGDARVLQIPVYHFHDGFLKYTSILKENYPTKLNKNELDDQGIADRFFKASIGWVKYKPLLIFITDRNNYKEIINETRKNLKLSIPKMNKAFEGSDFTCLLKELDEYDKNVEKHYKEYIRTTEVWNDLKDKLLNYK